MLKPAGAVKECKRSVGRIEATGSVTKKRPSTSCRVLVCGVAKERPSTVSRIKAAGSEAQERIYTNRIILDAGGKA